MKETGILDRVRELLEEKGVEVVLFDRVKPNPDVDPVVYRDGQNLEARSRMAWANTLAGLCLTLAGACGLHGLEHPVSGYLDVPHEEGLAVLSLGLHGLFLEGSPRKVCRCGQGPG